VRRDRGCGADEASELPGTLLNHEISGAFAGRDLPTLIELEVVPSAMLGLDVESHNGM
jgi:hypothetical protein